MKNELAERFYNIFRTIKWYSTFGVIACIASVFFIPHVLLFTLAPTFLSMSLVCLGTNEVCKDMKKELEFQKVLERILALQQEGYDINIEFDSQEMLEYYYENPDKLNQIVDQLVEVANMPEDDVDVNIVINQEGETEFYFKDEEASESLIQMVIERAKQMAREQGIELTDEEINQALQNVQGEGDLEDAESVELIDDADCSDDVELIDDERYPEYPGTTIEGTEELDEDRIEDNDNSNDLSL